MTATDTLQLCLLVPVCGALGVAVTGRWPNLRELVTFATAMTLFVLVASLLPVLESGETPRVTLVEPIAGAPIALALEPLGMLFALIASFLWIVTSFYAVGYMRGHHETNQTRFFVCFAVAIFAVMGIALAANLFTLFIFYEVLTISTYPLVTHAGNTEAKRGGRIYLGILIGTSVGLLLFALLWTWHLAGTLDFVKGGILAGKAEPWQLSILLALFVFGTGKAAIMPFHRWLPAAMVAPTPVSALLHAVAVVKAGVFTVLKVIVYIFGVDLVPTLAVAEWLMYLAGASILLASFVAMTKDNLKARLAYSTVSQLGYITLGALLATSSGVVGSAMHIATHAFGKITLFFCAGAIMVALHKTEISDMVGIGRKMPFTMFAFLIGAISIIGLPPMAGTWSKWYLAIGTLEAEQQLLLAVLMLSSLLNIAYLLPIPVRAFYGVVSQEGGIRRNEIKEAPWPCLLAMGVTSFGCVALFLFPEPLYALASRLVG